MNHAQDGIESETASLPLYVRSSSMAAAGYLEARAPWILCLFYIAASAWKKICWGLQIPLEIVCLKSSTGYKSAVTHLGFFINSGNMLNTNTLIIDQS